MGAVSPHSWNVGMLALPAVVMKMGGELAKYPPRLMQTFSAHVLKVDIDSGFGQNSGHTAENSALSLPVGACQPSAVVPVEIDAAERFGAG